jgi:hypothetical protein
MRKFLLSLISVFVITSAVYSQGSVDRQTEKRRFRITSILVNGQEVPNFRILFLVTGREITPEKQDGIFFVPDEVYKAPWQEKGVRIIAENLDVILNKMSMNGYLDSDDIKADYEINIDTIPLEIEAKHISKLNKRDKRSLGIRSYKDVCAVYSLAPSNIEVNKVNKPNLIVDPITIKQFNLCKTKN